MKVVAILLLCLAMALAGDDDQYQECMKKCSEIGEIHCPMIPAQCDEGYELKSCASGYKFPGDCCAKCVKISDGE